MQSKELIDHYRTIVNDCFASFKKDPAVETCEQVLLAVLGCGKTAIDQQALEKTIQFHKNEASRYLMTATLLRKMASEIPDEKPSAQTNPEEISIDNKTTGIEIGKKNENVPAKKADNDTAEVAAQPIKTRPVAPEMPNAARLPLIY